MRTKVIYTMNRPEAELETIRRLIAERSGLDANEIYPYALSAKDYGRIYYAVLEPTTARGLIFTIARRSTFNPKPLSEWAPQHVSEWEAERFFKLARTLDPGRVYSMLAPLRIFEDEIKPL